jgi:hypothetical protein
MGRGSKRIDAVLDGCWLAPDGIGFFLGFYVERSTFASDVGGSTLFTTSLFIALMNR